MVTGCRACCADMRTRGYTCNLNGGERKAGRLEFTGQLNHWVPGSVRDPASKIRWKHTRKTPDANLYLLWSGYSGLPILLAPGRLGHKHWHCLAPGWIIFLYTFPQGTTLLFDILIPSFMGHILYDTLLHRPLSSTILSPRTIFSIILWCFLA